jgi:molybdopterin-guanine dinucleotide biosynthesis protein A
MGGGDKGLLDLGGKTIIDHVIDRLAPQVATLAINANGDPSRFTDFGLVVLADSLPDHPGPLAGVLAGLDWALSQGATEIVTVATDTPFLPLDLVARLRDAKGPSGLSIAASVDAIGRIRPHPTCGLWPVSLRDDLKETLQQGKRKVMLWVEGHDAGIARFETASRDPFLNINTPEDIEYARRLGPPA